MSLSIINITCNQIVRKKICALFTASCHVSSFRRPRYRGIDILRDPRTNKGLAFTIRERQILGIHGLLPPNVKSQTLQLSRVLENLKRVDNDLNKYIYLLSLQDRNEKLFYRTIMENVEYCMPLIYTPTVGLACQKYGLIFRRPRGLYMSIYDKHYLKNILNNWPEENVRAIVVTDGERILGLGDLGAFGMGIPVGKLSLYTALGGLHPHQCLPILLDVGTNNEAALNDPLYCGIRRNRLRGAEYDEFVDLFMKAVVEKYGPQTLIQFEDFGNSNAYRLLEKYREKYCVFNDDIQGTAAVAVAGVIAAMRITDKKISDNIFLFQGAGGANLGIASLLLKAMEEEGTSTKEGIKKIFLIDKDGLIVQNRPAGILDSRQKPFAKDMQTYESNQLEAIVDAVRPTVLIGASAVPGAFTDRVLRSLLRFSARPVVFALSNPTSMAECTAEQAYTATDGHAIFASGSPFGAVSLSDGRVFHPGQGNNSYIFPGVALATITCGINRISDAIFLKAAQCLAKQVSDEDLKVGRLYPPLSNVRDVSLEIATSVAQYAYSTGNTVINLELENLREFIKNQMYSPYYDEVLSDLYDWPEIEFEEDKM